MIKEYHNKIEIKTSNNTYVFFNSMLETVYTKIAKLESFCDKMAFGVGVCDEISQINKLNKFKFLCDLSLDSLSNNLNSSELFVKKLAYIDTSDFNIEYLTEAGITSDLDDKSNPTIYNYFSLIDDENPNGLKITKGEPIVLIITIYLTLTAESVGLFTKGKNPFISFLLGCGLNNNSICAARGDNTSSNVLIERTNSYIGEKYPCSIITSINSGITLTFEADLKSGETSEVVFLVGDDVFARINTTDHLNPHTETVNFVPKQNYVVDLGKGVINVDSVINNSTVSAESDIYLVNYASEFASKIVLPFNNMFDVNTQRFLSKDGKKIFFVLNDYIYLYENSNHQVYEISLNNLQISNVYKICAFDNYVFIFSNESGISMRSYRFVYGTLRPTANNFSILENAGELIASAIDIDMVQANDGTILLGFYTQNSDNSSSTAYTVYLVFDPSFGFVAKDYVSTSGYNISYMLGFHKNNFSDAQFYYLQAGKYSYECARIIHSADKSVSDNYNVLAYYFTNDTRSICVKSRAVLIEKNSSPTFWVYYFPQIYRFSLSSFGDAVKNYMSEDLLYLIQKFEDGSFRAFNLVGYDNPEEFINGIPSEIDQNKLLSIEFLGDVVLFFMDDDNEPIVAYSLNNSNMCIENVSSNTDSYAVTLTRYKLIGSNNEGVIAKLTINTTIWFFQTKFTKYQVEQIYLYIPQAKTLSTIIFSTT